MKINFQMFDSMFSQNCTYSLADLFNLYIMLRKVEIVMNSYGPFDAKATTCNEMKTTTSPSIESLLRTIRIVGISPKRTSVAITIVLNEPNL